MTAMHAARTALPHDVFADLNTLAADAGMNLSHYIRQVLTAHVQSTSEKAPEVTAEAWLRFRKWVTSHPEAIAGYTGDRQWNVAANRAAVVAHATAHGYTPEPG